MRISKLGKIVNKEKRTIQYHRGGHSPEITFFTKSAAASICGQTIAYVHVYRVENRLIYVRLIEDLSRNGLELSYLLTADIQKFISKHPQNFPAL